MGLHPLSPPLTSTLGHMRKKLPWGVTHTQVTARPTYPSPPHSPHGFSSHGSWYQERCFRSFRAKHILSAIPSKRDRNTEQGRSPISVSDTNCTPTLTDPCGCFSAICSEFRGQKGPRLDSWQPLNLYRPDPGSAITFFKGFWSQ